ncbi:hypothetical protein [Teichococcus deserti]|uniref:hypothetical protein n=1 Tax=Teichococcus deserti TaxID=1817963 RepID=UPI001A97B838|nr:hypothetical protein [Pseudoroseomonas deserti]
MRGIKDALLPGYIIHLANRVQAWVASQVARITHNHDVDLDTRLLEILDRIYGEKVVGRTVEVNGDSTRLYSMSAVVALPDNRTAIFRTVVDVPQSFFACHTAFGDIALAHPDSERIAVISAKQRWTSADLSLVGQTATHIVDLDSQPEYELRRLAA